MADWVRDLQDLLGGIAPGEENLPFDELSRGDWGGAATAPLTAAFNFMDLPLSMVKENIGTQMALPALLQEGLGIMEGPDSQRAVDRFREGGGRANWEHFIEDKPMPVKMALELGLDPVNWTGVGAVAEAGRGLRGLAGAEGVSEASGAFMRSAGDSFEAVDAVFNRIPWEVTKRAINNPATRPIGRAAKAGVERVIPDAFEVAPKWRVARRVSDIATARRNQLSNRRQGVFGRNLPVPWNAPGKSLAPITEYDVPPFFDTTFDSGVPSAVKQKAFDAHKRLMSRQMSFPDIPGVNVAGVGEAPWHLNAKEVGPVPYGKDRATKSARQSFMDRWQRLGIINNPGRRSETRFNSPFDLSQLTQDDIWDMAQIGAAVMVDFDNDVSNKMFSGILRAGPGFQNVRRRIIEEFGPGIEPVLPAMFDDFRNTLAEEGVSIGEGAARFLTHWGFPEGRIDTSSLERLQAKLDSGEFADDSQFFEKVLLEFKKSKGMTSDPLGAVETAAGMGGGFLSTVRPESLDQGMTQFGGEFGITGNLDPRTGRAEVPGAFTSQFTKNHDAYNTYMRQLFGDLTDPELDILREMSIESLYDEMVNAAGEFSGGNEGATYLLGKGEGARLGRDEHTKISARGTRETDISQNKEEFQAAASGGFGGKHGQASLKRANTLRYERLMGKAPTKSWTNAKIVQELEKAGHSGITANKKGGPLATVQEIVTMYAAGAEITPGNRTDQFYQDAVDEIMNIVGPGRYEDALMLIELVAITSSGTGVQDNAENAIRAFAEWKLGSDKMIREGLGLTDDQVDRLLNRGERWGDTKALRADKNPVEGDELFMAAMARNQKKDAGNLFAEYVRRRSAIDEGWTPGQAGPKTNNFAGSHVVKLWFDAINHAMGDTPLARKVKKALDEAATIYTLDRHESRVDNLATAVSDMGAVLHRESRLIANKQLPEVRPEDMQAAVWFWSKDAQGFVPVERTDDMANALRDAWNRKVNPGRHGDVRQKLKAQFPDWTEEMIVENADDMMRQEAVMAIIKDQLKDVKGIDLATINDMGETVLGIVGRSARGVAPAMRVGPQIPRLVSLAEQTLGRVNAGEIEGATFKWSGTDFVPEDTTTGFAVALTSAGTSVSTGKRKTSAKDINAFLSKFGDILDDPTVRDNVRFGIYKMGDKEASFDLTVIVPDETTAIGLAKRANQQSVYDIGTGNIIDTGGTGEPVLNKPDDIRRAIEDVFGRTPTDQPSVGDVRARGVTIEEMDSVNPLSILQRKVVRPIMERFEESSQKAARATATTPSPSQAIPVDSPDPTSPVDFGEIYQDPLLSTQENMLLNEDFDGSSIGSKLDEYHAEAERDLAALDGSGVMWGPNTPLDERLEMVKDSPELVKIVKKYADEGIDIRYATADDVELHRLQRAMAKKEGIDVERQTTWDLIRAAWGEQALFSPKYHLGNIQGAWIQNALGGTFRAGTPGEFLAALKLTRGGLDEIGKKEAIDALYVGQVAQKWGFEQLPSYLNKGGVRSMTSSRTRMSGSAVGELAGRVTRNERLGRAVGRPFEYNADMSQAVETVMRGALWGDVLDREMRNSVAILEDEIATMAHRQGLADFEFSFTQNINAVPGGPSPKRLKDHLMNLGFRDGYAERAGRSFAEARNKAEKMARAEVDKRQFSYDRTNLDEFVAKFIPFHYWFSRALRYYGEEAVRHPYLILNYMRANEGIEAAQDDPGLDARQKGFIRLMGTPLGFTLLMNPDALFGVVKVFGFDDPGIETDGETKAGGVIKWLKNRGFGLYPWIDGTLNLMGTYGDTFEPDLLGIRHKALIGATVNFMRSQLGMDPAAAPYQTAMGQARWNVSSFVSQFAPDWLSAPVLPKAGNNTTEATMDTLIESRIIANNPRLSNGQLLDIMTDQENPEYQEAFQQVAAAGMAQQLINFTAPQNYRVREASRDVRNAQIGTIWEAAEKQGVSATEFKPTVGDVEFATTYKNLTGRDWKPGDYANAQAESDLTRATPEAKGLVLQEQEFHSLGGDKNREIFRKYQDIVNGKHPETATLDRDSRRIVADNWADKLGYRDNIDYVYRLRESYEATHQEFAQFRGWQDQMFDLSNHLGGDLGEYRRQASEQNPNARHYFEDMIRHVQTEYPQDKWVSEIDRRTTNSEAYQAITGQAQMRYDPAPVPGFPQGDPTLPQMAPVGGQAAYNPDYDWYQAMQNLQY